jgi:transmembrane sensor
MTQDAMSKAGLDVAGSSDNPMSSSQPNRNTWWRFSIAAAILFVVLTSVFFVFPSFQTNQQQIASKIYQTAIGERSSVTLSDGSQVTLNTNSRIEVSFSEMRRAIKLVRGQGFFDVTKDIGRPFIVEVGNKRVVALGTAFDIRLDDNQQVQVTLIEGRVAVDNINKANSVVANSEQLEQVVELTPGDRLTAEKEKVLQVVSLKSIDEAVSWRDGRLVYRREPISLVIAEANRYLTKKIKLSDDPRIQKIQISGVFDTNDMNYFVESLTRMHPLQTKQSSNNQLLLSWKE